MIGKKSMNKLRSILAVLVLLYAPIAYAQVAPTNKYDISSYPEDRKAIEIISRKNDSTRFNNDDYIAVGPEGRISYGFDD
jgi:hypothetical protein